MHYRHNTAPKNSRHDSCQFEISQLPSLSTMISDTHIPQAIINISTFYVTPTNFHLLLCAPKDGCSSEILVEELVGDTNKIRKVVAHNKIPHQREVAVLGVLDLDGAPLCAAHELALSIVVSTHHGKRHLAPPAVDHPLILLIIIIQGKGEHPHPCSFQVFHHTRLKVVPLIQRQCVCLCNDGHDICNFPNSLHALHINGFKTVAGGGDEIQNHVHSCVCNVMLAFWAELLIEIRLVLVLDILDNRHPRICVVDLVTESRGINNSQFNASALLLDGVCHAVNFHSGRDIPGCCVPLRSAEQRLEQRVLHGGLAQATATDQHDVELEPMLERLFLKLPRQCVNPNLPLQWGGQSAPVGHPPVCKVPPY
eukprot:comp19181_c0_seq1/m.21886 comp19181_c0_seq1/g.21886  ORF comp19181_c0_seq1/g.21886 comp19181_c0_seq1/m.21886 type:complete len:367 (+) comp19181_c0_seq1:266-1366(+)